MRMNAASALLLPPHMYSMPWVIRIGGFDGSACAEVHAPRKTSAAKGHPNRFGFIASTSLQKTASHRPKFLLSKSQARYSVYAQCGAARPRTWHFFAALMAMPAAAAPLHVDVRRPQGVLLDELPPRLDLVTHQHGEHAVGLDRIVDL